MEIIFLKTSVSFTCDTSVRILNSHCFLHVQTKKPVPYTCDASHLTRQDPSSQLYHYGKKPDTGMDRKFTHSYQLVGKLFLNTTIIFNCHSVNFIDYFWRDGLFGQPDLPQTHKNMIHILYIS